MRKQIIKVLVPIIGIAMVLSCSKTNPVGPKISQPNSVSPNAGVSVGNDDGGDSGGSDNESRFYLRVGTVPAGVARIEIDVSPGSSYDLNVQACAIGKTNSTDPYYLSGGDYIVKPNEGPECWRVTQGQSDILFNMLLPQDVNAIVFRLKLSGSNISVQVSPDDFETVSVLVPQNFLPSVQNIQGGWSDSINVSSDLGISLDSF